MSSNIVYRYAYKIPGERPHIEPPKLVIRQIGNKTYYWNHQKQTWVRLTRRCPYL